MSTIAPQNAKKRPMSVFFDIFSSRKKYAKRTVIKGEKLLTTATRVRV